MLGGVHRLVGAAEQIIDLPLGVLGARKADGGGGAMLGSVRQRVLRLGDGAAYALCSDTRPGLGGLRERHDELLTTPPRDEVALARDVGEHACDSLENGIARIVTQGVVDLLEM